VKDELHLSSLSAIPLILIGKDLTISKHVVFFSEYNNITIAELEMRNFKGENFDSGA